MGDGDRGEMFAELERASDELDRALEQLRRKDTLYASSPRS